LQAKRSVKIHNFSTARLGIIRVKIGIIIHNLINKLWLKVKPKIIINISSKMDATFEGSFLFSLQKSKTLPVLEG